MKLDVLVVDDDLAMLRVLGLYFETVGYEVRVALDGAEALAEVKRQQPNVMIIDAMMPVLSGVEVCRQVRKLEGGQAIRIVVLTANGRIEAAAAGAGADTFMTKPFSLQDLSAAVRGLSREASPA